MTQDTGSKPAEAPRMSPADRRAARAQQRKEQARESETVARATREGNGLSPPPVHDRGRAEQLALELLESTRRARFRP